MAPFSCCCDYATADHIRMQVFNFVTSSVCFAYHGVLTPHISKSHLPISSLNVLELELK